MPFHVIGLKCVHCGSYNTCQDSEPSDAEAATAEQSATVTQGPSDDADDGGGDGGCGSTSAAPPHDGTDDAGDRNTDSG